VPFETAQWVAMPRRVETATRFFALFAEVREAWPLQFGRRGGDSMLLKWALIFFVLAILAALFGFGGIAGAAAGIAKLLFFGFIVLAAIVLVAGLARGRTI
jgi:uncharacterized membrane protein YtjA (UPF0391 family)